MRTIIISNGEINNYNYCKKIIKNDDCIICADGGARHAYNMKLKPDIIIGDLDSLDEFYVEFFKSKDTKFIKYPAVKDKTDTHLCILKAMGFSDEIILLGALGNRIDHTLANISLLKLGIDEGIRICIMDKETEISLIDKSVSLLGKPGDIFSLFPFEKEVKGLYVKGAKYTLENAQMSAGNPYGISNEFLEEKVDIEIEKGILIVIKSKD